MKTKPRQQKKQQQAVLPMTYEEAMKKALNTPLPKKQVKDKKDK